MRAVCLYFQIHQPFRLKTYRFFDMGKDHHYYDDYQNRTIIRRVAQKCYLPANQILKELIAEYPDDFRVSFSISGTALDQLEMYAPEVIESFRQLAETGNVEFLAETDSHSLVSMRDEKEFQRQVNVHREKIQHFFGQSPKSFRNTELIYSNRIGELAYDMGFTTMLTEGAKHILGWRSPNFLYYNAANPKLKVLLRNFRLSDDIAFRFSARNWAEWPLTAAKFASWLRDINPEEEVVNLFMDYETFGEHQWEETGIFRFLRSLPEKVIKDTGFRFMTPSQIGETLQPVAKIDVPYAVSWADEERDLTAWLGNELQDEAFDKLYRLLEAMELVTNDQLLRDWQYLQTSDHFYYMCTKWFSDGEVHKYFNPYTSPYEAFINYMNVLSDFTARVETHTKHRTSQVLGQPRVTLVQRSRPVPSKPTRPTAQTDKSLNWEAMPDVPKIYLKQALKHVAPSVLATALFDASAETKERLVGCMGRRPLNEYMSLRLKTPASKDIKEARTTILREVHEVLKTRPS